MQCNAKFGSVIHSDPNFPNLRHKRLNNTPHIKQTVEQNSLFSSLLSSLSLSALLQLNPPFSFFHSFITIFIHPWRQWILNRSTIRLKTSFMAPIPIPFLIPKTITTSTTGHLYLSLNATLFTASLVAIALSTRS